MNFDARKYTEMNRERTKELRDAMIARHGPQLGEVLYLAGVTVYGNLVPAIMGIAEGDPRKIRVLEESFQFSMKSVLRLVIAVAFQPTPVDLTPENAKRIEDLADEVAMVVDFLSSTAIEGLKAMQK